VEPFRTAAVYSHLEERMMDQAVTIAVHVAIVFGTIVIHEIGHFLAGLAGGVSPRRMKIVLLRYPFHVALREGDQWLSPTDGTLYASAAQTLIPHTAGLFLFVAGD
jgi:hypothetical protein